MELSRSLKAISIIDGQHSNQIKSLANKNPCKHTICKGFEQLSWKDLNLRMQESKSCALPLGDSPKDYGADYIIFFTEAQTFFVKIL